MQHTAQRIYTSESTHPALQGFGGFRTSLMGETGIKVSIFISRLDHETMFRLIKMLGIQSFTLI